MWEARKQREYDRNARRKGERERERCRESMVARLKLMVARLRLKGIDARGEKRVKEKKVRRE
jgi:hypothetical protein